LFEEAIYKNDTTRETVSVWEMNLNQRAIKFMLKTQNRYNWNLFRFQIVCSDTWFMYCHVQLEHSR